MVTFPSTSVEPCSHSLDEFDGTGVEVSWERNSGTRRDLCDGEVLADACSLPKRRMAAGKRAKGDSEVTAKYKALKKGSKNQNLTKFLEDFSENKGYEHYRMRLDHYFEECEKWLHWVESGRRDWGKFCEARTGFLAIAANSGDYLDMFSKAINELIEALRVDPWEDSTSENLCTICGELEAMIQAPSGGSTVKLEKLTEAFGLALMGLVIHHHANHSAALSEADRKEIYKKAEEVKKVTQKIENLNIKYNLAFIEEGVKRLKDKPRWTLIAKKGGASIWTIIKDTLRPFSVIAGAANPTPAGVGIAVDPVKLCEALESLCRECKNLAKNKDLRKKQPWYEPASVLLEFEKLAMEDAGVYENCAKFFTKEDKNTAKEWYYAKTQFLRNVIKSTKKPKIRNKAINAFLADESSRKLSGVKSKAELEEFVNKSIDENWRRHWDDIRAKRREADQIYEWEKPVGTFTGRRDYLRKIEQRLALAEDARTRMVVLKGMGGVGKTQLARKFVMENGGEYSMVYTFDGHSQGTLHEGYQDLANKLEIELGGSTDRRKIRGEVNGVLEGENRRDWLLLFDNVDDSKVLASLCRNLPKHGGGVLITSRKMPPDEKAAIEVKEFERSHSIELLKKIIKKNKWGDEKVLGDLAKELGDFPLALAQAGAYIQRTDEADPTLYGVARYNVGCYLKDFRDEPVELLKGHKRTEDYKKTVATTWNITLKGMQKKCKWAGEIFSLFAHLNSKRIPVQWLGDWLKECKGIGSGPKLRNKKEEIRGVLIGYSMLRYEGEEERNFYMHPLLQQIVRERLEDEERTKVVVQALGLVKRVFDSYDEKEMGTQEIGQKYLPHAMSVIEYLKQIKEDLLDGKSLKEKADLYAQVGRYIYNVQGMAFQAEEYLEIALGIYRRIHGKSHLKVANILNSLGTVRMTLGGGKVDSNERTTQARNDFIEALRIYKEIDKNNANANNRKMLFDSLVNLGSFSRELEAYMDAIVLYEEAWEIVKDTIGDKVALIADWAEAWERVNEKRAKELYGEIARFWEEWKANHKTKERNDDDAITLSRFGEAYCKLKDNDKAKEFGKLACNRASSAKIKALTATKYGDILTQCDGAQEDVLGRYKQAVGNYENYYGGNNHQDVASAWEKLGDFQLKVGNKGEAVGSYEQAREICEKVYGEKPHPNKALILEKLGGVYSEEEIQKAVKFYEQALEINTILYGEAHPEVRSIYKELGKIYEKLGNTAKANECEEKAEFVEWWGIVPFSRLYVSDDSLKNKILVHCANLQFLDLSGCYNLETPDFSGCTCLQELTLPRNITDSSLKAILSQCPASLQTLELNGCDNLQNPDFSGCFSLQTLELSSCHNLQNPDFNGCSCLQTLDLSWCKNLQNPDFSGCSNLQTLALPTNVTDLSLKTFLSQCSACLQILDLKACKNLQNPDFSGCSNLQTLALPINITDSSLKAFLAQCPACLQTLDLSSCHNLQNPDFSGCSNLQTLALPINITDSSLKAFLAQCPACLQTLDLSWCENLQNPDFSGCSSLQTLKLPNNITDSSLKAFLAQCPASLQTLDLSWCHNLQNPDFNSCSNLQTLTLPGNITDTSLKAFLAQCPACLQTLDLSWCENLQSPDFSGCSNLQTLTLPGNITDTSLKAFLAQCPANLQTLDLKKCKNLQNPDFSNYSNLQILKPTTLLQNHLSAAV